MYWDGNGMGDDDGFEPEDACRIVVDAFVMGAMVGAALMALVFLT